MRAAMFCAVSVLALGLTACSDPEKEANILFVDAANTIQAASSLDTLAKYRAYTEARAKLDQLNLDQFKGTQASLKVASQEKIGGLSSSELNAELERLAVSNAVCAVTRSEECKKIIVKSIFEILKDDSPNFDRRQEIKIFRSIFNMYFSGYNIEFEEFLNLLRQRGGSFYAGELARMLANHLKLISEEYSKSDISYLFNTAFSADDLQLNRDEIPSYRQQLFELTPVHFKVGTALDRAIAKMPDGREYSNILEQLFELELIKTGQNVSSNSIQDLFSALEESEQISVLSRVAVINQKSFFEILKYFPDEKLRSHLYRAMLKDGLWKWRPEQRLAVLLQMPPDILQTSTSVVIDVVLSNRDRPEEVRTLLDAIANVPSSHADNVMAVYIPLRSFLEGTGDLTEVVDQVQRELGSGSISESVLRTCTAAPEILKAVGKSALLPSLADACMPVYQHEGKHVTAAGDALVKMLQSSGGLNADELSKINENASGYEPYLRSIDQVSLAFVQAGNTELALNVARTARPGKISYRDLLQQAMSAEGAEPQAIWDEIKSTNLLDSLNWMVPHEELTAAGAAFLDKIIAEDADFMAQSILDANNRQERSNGFALLSKERLLALAKNVSKPELKNEVLNALALKIRANDPAEMIDAVWNLPDNNIDAALRITSIRLGLSLPTADSQ